MQTGWVQHTYYKNVPMKIEWDIYNLPHRNRASELLKLKQLNINTLKKQTTYVPNWEVDTYDNISSHRHGMHQTGVFG